MSGRDIAELWGAPDGQIYYRMHNWHGFFVCVPNLAQHVQGQVQDVPERAVCLIRDGKWTGNFIGPAASPAWRGEGD